MYLAHHGIKGQKWGVRRYQNPDGTLTNEGKRRYSEVTDYGVSGKTIPKGSTLYRVSVDKTDKTFDNKKYVSTSKYDNALWEDYMVDAYKSRGREVYAVKYKTTQDIKVADQTRIGKLFMDSMQANPDETTNQTYGSMNFLRYHPDSITSAEAASINMAAQTNLGKQFINQLMNEGYGAVSDVHGRNVSNDPLIIFDPEKRMKKTSIKQY